MKYALLFYGTREQQQAWEAMTEEARTAQYAQAGRWVAEHAAQVGAANKFQPPHTATTVRFQGEREPLIHDGPFIEGNEVIGGYAEINVADLDEALHLVKTWPVRADIVEIRPVESRPGRAGDQ
jgi:hypothetical protein